MSIYLFLFFIFKTLCFNKTTNITELNDYEFKKNKVNKRKLSSVPLKIYIDKYYFNKTFRREDINKTIIFNALDKAKSTLETLIEVVDEDTSLITINDIPLDVYGFAESSLSDSLKNDGVMAHLLILFRGIDSNIDSSNKCIDKLGIIQQKDGNNRPFIGYIIFDTNLNIEILDNNNTYKEEYLSYLFLHQITHILGFNRLIVNRENSRMRIINITTTRTGGNINKEVIISDNLILQAKKYFNCYTDSVYGLELEDANPNNCGNEFIHWDERMLLGDYMTYDINVQEQVISTFTLLFLEETGFYKVNYFTGGLMKFGKNKGCAFFTSDCNSILPENEQTANTQRKSNFENEFCTSGTKTTCSSARLSRGLCENNIDGLDIVLENNPYVRTNWRPKEGMGNYGNELADYCPIPLNEKERTSNKIKSFIGNCKLGMKKDYGRPNFALWDEKYNSSIYNYSIFSETYGEKFSERSFCAFSSVIQTEDPKKEIYKDFIRPTCYEMFCSSQLLTIKINNQYIVCPKGGGFVNIGGNYEGHLLCPDYNLICDQDLTCNNLFDCVRLGSIEKGLTDDYTKTNVSIEIKLPGNKALYNKSYESANDGQCPIYCSECYEDHKCFECSPSFPYYIGKKKDDRNPIICNKTINTTGYYNITIGKNNYYFECFERCLYCTDEKKCYGCDPKYYLGKNNETCEEQIRGCKTYEETSSIEHDPKNGNYPGYKICKECDNNRDFYCINEDKQHCSEIKDINAYYNLDNGCKRLCSDLITNCYRCNSTQCFECKDGWHFNSNRTICLEDIPHCDKHNEFEDECDKCEDGYYCFYGDKRKCIEEKDISSYYNISIDGCYEKCSDIFKRCIRCDKNNCYDCENSYFIYNNKECIEGIEHCMEHYYDIANKYCEKCEMNYYCVNNTKEVCTYIGQNEITLYYHIDPANEYSCIEKCSKKYNFCLKCNNTDCEKCDIYTIKDSVSKRCVIDPTQVIIDGCSIKIQQIEDNINKIDLDDYLFNYYPNLPSISVIDHYINQNYTLTVFLNSDCTEDLLNQGYYKIDSNELQKAIANEFTINEKVIFSVFVTHNYKSHFRYYDNSLKFLDTSVNHDSVNNIYYTITNKFIRSVNNVLGPIVATLIENEKLNIFERDSDFFHNYCNNITLLGIDLPLSKRLYYLYLHDYSTQIACLGEKCELEKYNFDESLVTCKCKIGNTFDDILTPFAFKHYEGSEEKANNFIDSIGIIKCAKNGFNSKNMKANAGMFLSLIGIVAQIILFIYYLLFSKAVIIPKGISNPPKKPLIIISDWNKDNNKNNKTETEVYIQPRDDDDEQLLEEEKSFSNDPIDLINYSIDTEVEGNNLKTEKNKFSEKPEKRILILLNYKEGKTPKHLKKEYQDSSSEGEIIKFIDENIFEKLTFWQIYWFVVSLKQHIINFFSFIKCCKITNSFFPLPLRIIRSLFLIFLSFVFNILFLNQNYYINKFNYFNDKFTIIYSKNINLEISVGKKINYALSNTFSNAMISLILLLIVNFIVGFFFFSIRNKIIEGSKNNRINEILSKVKQNNILFFIINIVLMILFFMTITAFVGAYGGGFVDYLISGIISLVFFEIIPFIWSLILAFLIYFGSKKKIKWCSTLSNFFIF